MEAYGYAMQALIWMAWVVLAVVAPGILYMAVCEVYDAFRQKRVTLSNIKAAFFMTADYVLYKVTRAKNAGRHARKVKKDDVNIVIFWREIRSEFETRPYSLMRVNSIHA
jgi:hypothetical protein